MNKIVGIVLAAIVIIGGIYLIVRAPNPSDVSGGNNSGNVDGEGRIIFSVTDAAVNMETLSELNMRISRVDLHSQAQGWLTVSTTPRSYELLELNESSRSELLADVTARAGTYDQVRLHIDQVNAVTTGGTTRSARLPSSEFTIDTKLVVEEGSTSSVNFDFLADKSLHVASNGEYVFAPVVKSETRSNAGVSVEANGTVVINGGDVDDTNTVGMDVDGSIKLNFELDETQRLDVKDNAVIKLDALLK